MKRRLFLKKALEVLGVGAIGTVAIKSLPEKEITMAQGLKRITKSVNKYNAKLKEINGIDLKVKLVPDVHYSNMKINNKGEKYFDMDFKGGTLKAFVAGDWVDLVEFKSGKLTG